MARAVPSIRRSLGLAKRHPLPKKRKGRPQYRLTQSPRPTIEQSPVKLPPATPAANPPLAALVRGRTP
jgi:hypothetical protein